MAIETTTLVPVLQFFPWSDTRAPLAGSDALRPMGELYSVIVDGVIAAPGASTNQVLRVDTTLPANFVYSLIDISMSMLGVGLATAGNWENLATCIIFDLSASPPVPNKEYGVNLVSDGVAQSDANWIQVWRPASPLPTYLYSGGSIVQTRYTNLTDNDIASSCNFIARFLQYSVAQQYDAGVNTPQLIR